MTLTWYDFYNCLLSIVQPNMYRLMQLSQTTIPVAATFSHLFSNKRKSNRIEFVTDFPEGDDAEVVSSLQVFKTDAQLLEKKMWVADGELVTQLFCNRNSWPAGGGQWLCFTLAALPTSLFVYNLGK